MIDTENIAQKAWELKENPIIWSTLVKLDTMVTYEVKHGKVYRTSNEAEF